MLLSLIVASSSLPETLLLMAFSSPPVNDRTEILQLLDTAVFLSLLLSWSFDVFRQRPASCVDFTQLRCVKEALLSDTGGIEILVLRCLLSIRVVVLCLTIVCWQR